MNVKYSVGNTRSMAHLFTLAPGLNDTWDSQDFSDMLSHQLTASLEELVAGLSPAVIEQFRQLQCQSGLTTYGQLLVCGQPPVMLLDLARQRFKTQARQDGGLLPVEVARLLYYVVVTAGVMRIGRWFSQLSDTELRSAVLWALDRPWLQDELLRQVLQQGQLHLDQLIGSQSNNLPSVAPGRKPS